MQQQQVAIDTCTIVRVVRMPGFADRLRRKLRGKSIRVVLCDTVIGELKKVLGMDLVTAQGLIRKLLGREVDVVATEDRHIAEAEAVSAQYHICHHGDDRILALCRDKGYCLITNDKNLHRVCGWLGVASFFPSEAANI